MKEREKIVWKDILPIMMSEEETDDEGFLSQGLTKLDNRVKKKANLVSLHGREAMELHWMLQFLQAVQSHG